jgi:hypothetical protein
MEGHTLPPSVLPQLRMVTLNVSNGQHMGMWTAKKLALLGVGGAHAGCSVAVEADSAIIHLDKLRKVLAESGMLQRVCSLSQKCWGVQGHSANFGQNVEVGLLLPGLSLGSHIFVGVEFHLKLFQFGTLREVANLPMYFRSTLQRFYSILVQVSAKLKLVRLECVDLLIHNTLEHDNLTALCFAPMLKKVWSRSLIQEINRKTSSSLRNLTVNFR